MSIRFIWNVRRFYPLSTVSSTITSCQSESATDLSISPSSNTLLPIAFFFGETFRRMSSDTIEIDHHRRRGSTQAMTGLENADEESQSAVHKPSVQCADSWTGTMAKHYLSIFTAWTFAAVPLAIPAIAFFTVIEHSKPKASPGSYYSDGQNNLPLGSAYYSTIPSAQLTFIASFSSTLATAILPAVMALFSYTVARTVSQNSDMEDRQRLPSPYQLELLITTLNGSLLVFWSFAIYTLGYKRKKVAMVNVLWKAIMVFTAITLLAYGNILQSK